MCVLTNERYKIYQTGLSFYRLCQALGVELGGSKGQISSAFNYKVNFNGFYTKLCVFSQINDIKHIEQNFHSVAWVMPQGWDLGVLGVSKILAWRFVMLPPWTAHSSFN